MTLGHDYAEALAQAQAQGYAEADPTDDVGSKPGSAGLDLLLLAPPARAAGPAEDTLRQSRKQHEAGRVMALQQRFQAILSSSLKGSRGRVTRIDP
jgi:hypothetical protein